MDKTYRMLQVAFCLLVVAQVAIVVNTVRITRVGQDRWTGTDMKTWVESLKKDNPGLVVSEPVHK